MDLGRVFAGALGRIGDQIKENKDYMREQEQAKADYLFQTHLKNQQKQREAESQLRSAYNILRRNNVDDRRLRYFLREAPQELINAANLVNRDTEGKITPTMLNSYFKVAEEAPDVSGSVSELITSAIRGYDENAADLIRNDPAAAEKNVWQKVFGGVDPAEINLRVARREIVPGLTGAQIMAGMDQFGTYKDSGEAQVDRSAFASMSASDRNNYTRSLQEDYLELMDTELSELARVTDPTAEQAERRDTLLEINSIKMDSPAETRREQVRRLMEIDPAIARRYLDTVGPSMFTSNPYFELDVVEKLAGTKEPVRAEPASAGAELGADVKGSTPSEVTTTKLPPKGAAAEGTAEEPEEVYVPADDITVNLLETYGSDIEEFLKSKNVESQEDMFYALVEWGQQNSKTLPGDKRALIAALADRVLQSN